MGVSSPGAMHTSDLVVRFLDHVDAHYIIAERTAAIRARIEAKLAAGAYASLAPQAFAESMTADLRECADDLHFKVVYKEEAQPARESATEETPEEVAEFRRIARFNNYGCSEVKRLAGNVGYWRIDEFYDLIDGSGPTFVASMRMLSNTDAILVDVRNNSGGDPAAVALACSFFFDVEPVLLNTLEGRNTDAARQWWTATSPASSADTSGSRAIPARPRRNERSGRSRRRSSPRARRGTSTKP